MSTRTSSHHVLYEPIDTYIQISIIHDSSITGYPSNSRICSKALASCYHPDCEALLTRPCLSLSSTSPLSMSKVLSTYMPCTPLGSSSSIRPRRIQGLFLALLGGTGGLGLFSGRSLLGLCIGFKFGGLAFVYLRGGLESGPPLTFEFGLPEFHGGISCSIGALYVEPALDSEVRFQPVPTCERRIKIGIEPDTMLLSQEDALEVCIFVKRGFITGRQALMVPSSASRFVKRATKL